MSRFKFKLDREDIHWGWLVVAVACFSVLTAAVIHEGVALAALDRARAQRAAQDSAAAATTYHRLLRQYPLAIAVVPARRELLAVGQYQPGQVRALLAGPSQTWAERLLGRDFGPEYVDWLPLWGWLLCGLGLLALTLTRLIRRSAAVLTALGLAVPATVGTVLIWSWYGFGIGQWSSWLAQCAAPVLARPVLLHLATWALAATTAAVVIAPYRRPRPPDPHNHKVRPVAPTDPRMALLLLEARKTDQHCTAEAYAAQREAILASI